MNERISDLEARMNAQEIRLSAMEGRIPKLEKFQELTAQLNKLIANQLVRVWKTLRLADGKVEDQRIVIAELKKRIEELEEK